MLCSPNGRTGGVDKIIEAGGLGAAVGTGGKAPGSFWVFVYFEGWETFINSEYFVGLDAVTWNEAKRLAGRNRPSGRGKMGVAVDQL
uniref:Uncharacterized protein n=1 Tax=Magallana gigas TaxID=29159 RepID=K1RDN5_MAGGI